MQAGYGVIQDRTFGHFGKLLDAGFDRYISINRFDISRAAIPFQGASANPRYHFDTTDQGVNVLFAKASQLYEASGRATQVGEVGAVVRFSEPEFIEGLRRLKPATGNMLDIRFLERGRSVRGRIVEVDLKSDPALVEVDFEEAVSLLEIADKSLVPSERVRLILGSDDHDGLTFDLVSRRLFNFFELVEGLRSILNDCLRSINKNSQYAAPPKLVSLQIASPADLVLDWATEFKGYLQWSAGSSPQSALV